MTITQYIETVTHPILVNECMELIMAERSSIETLIDRLIARNEYLEEDNSSYSSLIPRLQTRFDEAMREAELILEYERTLDWKD